MSERRAGKDVLGADRIRHGIRSIEDRGLGRELADRGVVLDVCPSSNLRTGVVASLPEHPLPDLLKAGVRCTVNTAFVIESEQLSGGPGDFLLVPRGRAVTRSSPPFSDGEIKRTRDLGTQSYLPRWIA